MIGFVNDLDADGWQIYGIVYDTNPYTGPASIVGQYGPYPAANGDPGSIQGVATGQGGPAQGGVVLSKYSDYNNPDQAGLTSQPRRTRNRQLLPAISAPGDLAMTRKLATSKPTAAHLRTS